MYIPKKKKWNTLGEFKQHLEKDTKEKVVFFNGWKLVTTDTQYGIVDSILYAKPREKEPEKEILKLGNRPKVAKKAKKKKEPVVKEKSRKQILEEMKERGRLAMEAKKKKGKKKS